jgi:hypothetical protein
MEEPPLYEQRVEILGRLIKTSSLTLKEALILLKDDEPMQFVPEPVLPWWGVPPDSLIRKGSGTANGGFVTTTTTTAHPTGHSSTDTTTLPPDIKS